jgi:hypothetical protein
VHHDHPCEDYAGCDIARARAEGYTYAAAHLLMGATETPTIGTLMELFPSAYEPLLRRPNGWPAGWDEWVEFHRAYGHMCPACNGCTYGDNTWTPVACWECNTPLPERESVETVH